MATIRKRSWTSGGAVKSAWIADYLDGAGVRRQKTFKIRRDADRWLIQARHQVDAGVHTPDSVRATIGEAVQLWVNRAIAEGLEPATLAQYRKHAEHMLAAIDGQTRLARITQARCEQLRDALLLTHSRLTAGKVLASFKAVLRDAKRRGLVAANAAADTTITTAGRHRRRLEVGVDVPTPAEVKALIEAADPKARALACLAALAGARASELRGLRWSDLTLGIKPTVTIAQRADFAGRIGAPKSASSRRTIPLAATAAGALRAWKLAQPPGRSLVFGTATDRPDALPNLRRRVLFPAQVAAGIVSDRGRAKYAAHAFRHYAISSWLAAGIDLKTAQGWAGHATLALTLDTYGHLIPRQDDHDRIAAAERLLG